MECRECNQPVDRLEVFPGGLCLDCWSVSDEGKRMVSADELVRMWGG